MNSQHRYELVKISGDSQGGIVFSEDPVHRQRFKHIDIKYDFI